MVLLFADENGDPLPASDYGRIVEWCRECRKMFYRYDLRLGEDGDLYCAWCYDSTGQDPGALQGIDPEN